MCIPNLTTAMTTISNSAPTNIESLVEQILVKREISTVQQHQLKLILLYSSVSNQEKTLIDRVLYGIRHGLLQEIA
jgi:hypothetical protein